jgi:hypothetical protein
VPGWARFAFCDGPGPAPLMAGPVGENLGVRECLAGPGRPSVTDPSFVTNGRHHDLQASFAIENAEAGSASELKCRIVVLDRHTHRQPELI